MGRMIIEVEGEGYRTELLEGEAPLTCALWKDNLPAISLLSHAKICDNEITAQVPFFIDLEENMVRPGAGDIGFWRLRPTVCMWYDDMEPLGPTNLFARVVPDDLARFQAMARRVWTNPGAEVVFRLEGQS